MEDVAAAVGIKVAYFIVTPSCIPEERLSKDVAASSLAMTTTTSTSTTTRSFDPSNTKGVGVGLATASGRTTPPLPGDYSYSGVHDQGPLPVLKQGGPMALLLGCAGTAKEFNNSFITTLIEEERKQQPKLAMASTSNKSSLGPSSSKKRKT
jgi:hypothetical protein